MFSNVFHKRRSGKEKEKAPHHAVAESMPSHVSESAKSTTVQSLAVPPDPTHLSPSPKVSALADRRSPTPTPKPSVEHLSVTGDSFLRQPSPPPITNTVPPDPTHRPSSASLTPAAPVSYFEGAVNTTIHNPTFNNFTGDATIFKFDGDEPLHADLKALFVDHLTGSVETTDLISKLKKHNLSIHLQFTTRSIITLFDLQTLRLVHTFDVDGDNLSFSSNGSLLVCTDHLPLLTGLTDTARVTVWDVETRRKIAQFKSNANDIQRLVFSPNHSQLAALTPSGLEFFDIINKRTVDPRREEISWIFRNRALISRPVRVSGEPYRGYGKPLQGHFPGHRIPILWMPVDVGISAFTVESSTFALGCDDGRLITGYIPPALATS